MSDIKIFEQKPFYILLIEPGKIDDLDWNNPTYVQAICSKPFIKTFTVSTEESSPDFIFKRIQELLKVGSDDGKSHLVTEVICEEKNYLYEILYIDTLNKQTNMEHNQLATMLHLEGEFIHGNAIILKSYIPSLSNEISFSDMTNSEFHKILKGRGFTKLLVWEDDKWREEEIYGELEPFAKKFFEDERYQQTELGFLKHNINILYTKSEYGSNDVCGKLLKCKIDKCVVYSLLTKTIRANLFLDEFTKIMKLSQVLEEPYKPDSKWFEEEKDEHGRKIIKNKYRILDNVYYEKFNNN